MSSRRPTCAEVKLNNIMYCLSYDMQKWLSEMSDIDGTERGLECGESKRGKMTCAALNDSTNFRAMTWREEKSDDDNEKLKNSISLLFTSHRRRSTRSSLNHSFAYIFFEFSIIMNVSCRTLALCWLARFFAKEKFFSLSTLST